MMRELFLIALRNLLRNRRRSILTGTAIFTGAFMLTFGSAYGNGIEKQLVSTVIAGDTGHVTVAARVSKKTEQEELITNVTKWKDQLIGHADAIEKELSAYRGIRTVAKRVKINGMISNGEKLDSIFLIAVEPAKEAVLFRKVIPVDNGADLTVAGNFPEIYISHTVAKSFRVAVGDTLTVMAQTAGGSANTMDVMVKGIFKKGVQWRENFGYLRLADAQQLARIGMGMTQLNLTLDDEKNSKAVAGALRSKLAAYHVSVKDWEQSAGLFLGVVLFNRMAVYILCFVLFVVSMASIVNTMLMAVHERTREIGAMMAMGAKRLEIAALFVVEAFVLGGVTAGAGVLMAGFLAIWLGFAGIPAVNEALAYMYGGSKIYPYLSWMDVAVIYGLIVILVIVVAVYPAVTAARLKPVEALSSNQ